MRWQHGLRPTIYWKTGWGYCVLWAARVVSCVSRCQITNVEFMTEPCLSHLVFFSKTQDLSSFLPFNIKSRFRKLTMQCNTASLLSLLVFQRTNDNDWKSWGVNTQNKMLMCTCQNSKVCRLDARCYGDCSMWFILTYLIGLILFGLKNK